MLNCLLFVEAFIYFFHKERLVQNDSTMPCQQQLKKVDPACIPLLHFQQNKFYFLFLLTCIDYVTVL